MKAQENNWPSGLKKTKPRENVLTVLESANKPLSAVEICAKIQEQGNSAWLSTVYRILELFVKRGIVSKISVMGNDLALYEFNRYQHKHYAVCLGCRKIVPMDNCPMQKFIPQIEDSDFQVMGHNIEVYGYCGQCCKK